MPTVNSNQAQGNFFGTNAGTGTTTGQPPYNGARGGSIDFGGVEALTPALLHAWMTGSGASLGQVLTFSSAGVVWANGAPTPPASGGPYVMFNGAWTSMPNACTPPAGTPVGYVMTASTGSPGYAWVDANTVVPNPLIPPAGTPTGATVTYNANANPQYVWSVLSSGSSVPNPPSSGGPYALNVSGGTPSWVAIAQSVQPTLPNPPSVPGVYVLDTTVNPNVWSASAGSGLGSHLGSFTGAKYIINGPMFIDAIVSFTDGNSTWTERVGHPLTNLGPATVAVTAAGSQTPPVGALSMSASDPSYTPISAGGAPGYYGAWFFTRKPVGTAISTLRNEDII